MQRFPPIYQDCGYPESGTAIHELLLNCCFYEDSVRRQMPRCSYRKYTISEIINAVINNKFILKRFDEHPAWDNPDVPGEFTITADRGVR